MVQVKVRGTNRANRAGGGCGEGVGYRPVVGGDECDGDDIRALRACGLDGVIVREGVGLGGLAGRAVERGVMGLGVEVYGHVG